MEGEEEVKAKQSKVAAMTEENVATLILTYGRVTATLVAWLPDDKRAEFREKFRKPAEEWIKEQGL